jgi:hypothetical protein
MGPTLPETADDILKISGIIVCPDARERGCGGLEYILDLSQLLPLELVVDGSRTRRRFRMGEAMFQNLDPISSF